MVDQQSFNVWVQPLHDHRFLGFLGDVRRRASSLRGGTRAPSDAGDAAPRTGASRFQKVYARVAVPMVRALAAPDHLGRALGIGGSCSFIAERVYRANLTVPATRTNAATAHAAPGTGGAVGPSRNALPGRVGKAGRSSPRRRRSSSVLPDATER